MKYLLEEEFKIFENNLNNILNVIYSEKDIHQKSDILIKSFNFLKKKYWGLKDINPTLQYGLLSVSGVNTITFEVNLKTLEFSAYQNEEEEDIICEKNENIDEVIEKIATYIDNYSYFE